MILQKRRLLIACRLGTLSGVEKQESSHERLVPMADGGLTSSLDYESSHAEAKRRWDQWYGFIHWFIGSLVHWFIGSLIH